MIFKATGYAHVGHSMIEGPGHGHIDPQAASRNIAESA
jgi:hypothetical protein